MPGLTVTENLEMGAYSRRDKNGIAEDMERVFTLFPRLKERRRQIGGHTLGRRTADAGHRPRPDGAPTILLMDEPSMGLAPVLVEIHLRYHPAHQQGRHDHPAGGTERPDGALDCAPWLCLQTGEIVLHDTAENLKKNETVQKAYLGME